VGVNPLAAGFPHYFFAPHVLPQTGSRFVYRKLSSKSEGVSEMNYTHMNMVIPSVFLAILRRSSLRPQSNSILEPFGGKRMPPGIWGGKRISQ